MTGKGKQPLKKKGERKQRVTTICQETEAMQYTREPSASAGNSYSESDANASSEVILSVGPSNSSVTTGSVRLTSSQSVPETLVIGNQTVNNPHQMVLTTPSDESSTHTRSNILSDPINRQSHSSYNTDTSSTSSTSRTHVPTNNSDYNQVERSESHHVIMRSQVSVCDRSGASSSRTLPTNLSVNEVEMTTPRDTNYLRKSWVSFLKTAKSLLQIGRRRRSIMSAESTSVTQSSTTMNRNAADLPRRGVVVPPMNMGAAAPDNTNNLERQTPHIRAHTTVDYQHYLVPELIDVTNCGFYWGVMDRYEAEALLEDKPEGTFLLRDSSQDDFIFSVSFRRYGRSLHARIEQWNHQFSFDAHESAAYKARTVTNLLEHYKDPKSCMFFEPMLTRPLNRPKAFSLQHLARSVICDNITYDAIDTLSIPRALQEYLRYYHYKQKIRVRTHSTSREIHLSIQ